MSDTNGYLLGDDQYVDTTSLVRGTGVDRDILDTLQSIQKEQSRLVSAVRSLHNEMIDMRREVSETREMLISANPSLRRETSVAIEGSEKSKLTRVIGSVIFREFMFHCLRHLGSFSITESPDYITVLYDIFRFRAKSYSSALSANSVVIWQKYGTHGKDYTQMTLGETSLIDLMTSYPHIRDGVLHTWDSIMSRFYFMLQDDTMRLVRTIQSVSVDSSGIHITLKRSAPNNEPSVYGKDLTEAPFRTAYKQYMSRSKSTYITPSTMKYLINAYRGVGGYELKGGMIVQPIEQNMQNMIASDTDESDNALTPTSTPSKPPPKHNTSSILSLIDSSSDEEQRQPPKKMPSKHSSSSSSTTTSNKRTPSSTSKRTSSSTTNRTNRTTKSSSSSTSVNKQRSPSTPSNPSSSSNRKKTRPSTEGKRQHKEMAEQRRQSQAAVEKHRSKSNISKQLETFLDSDSD